MTAFVDRDDDFVVTDACGGEGGATIQFTQIWDNPETFVHLQLMIGVVGYDFPFGADAFLSIRETKQLRDWLSRTLERVTAEGIRYGFMDGGDGFIARDPETDPPPEAMCRHCHGEIAQMVLHSSEARWAHVPSGCYWCELAPDGSPKGPLAEPSAARINGGAPDS